MTPVGHSLCGLTIAALAIPSKQPPLKILGAAGLFMLFANAPDLPFPNWGHDRYEISHSLLVTATITIPLLVAGFLLRKTGKGIPPAVQLGLGATWFSHIILDSTYNHGLGLGVLWPVSNARLAMPLPWFETLRSPVNYLSLHSMKVMSIELLAFGIVLITALVFRITAGNRLHPDP